MPVLTENVHDLVGIGFGPSNLALAIALRELGDNVDAVFLERQPFFGWHRGMLIDGTTMQVSFLKDLATMRNPSSEFSFLNYLKDRGRLVDFINHKTMFPSRVEFHDYLAWAAGRFTDRVEYGAEVVAVHPVRDADLIVAADVVARDRSGALVTRRARNVVIAAGLEPVLPEGFAAGDRIWHSHDLMRRLPDLTEPRRLLVVGAGQSAAEVTDHLHRTYPAAEVYAVFTKFGYTPADDSPFANRIFDPAAVDTFYGASDEVKRMLMDYHRSTNYSAVDSELIDDLYRRAYQERVQGTPRLRVLNVSRIVAAVEHPAGVRSTVEFLPTGERTVIDADAVVCATGYRCEDPARLLGEVAAYCQRRPDGHLAVGRDYRLVTAPEVRCGLYVQGATEHTHGLSSTLLSNTAIRAGEIACSLAHTPVLAG